MHPMAWDPFVRGDIRVKDKKKKHSHEWVYIYNHMNFICIRAYTCMYVKKIDKISNFLSMKMSPTNPYKLMDYLLKFNNA